MQDNWAKSKIFPRTPKISFFLQFLAICERVFPGGSNNERFSSTKPNPEGELMKLIRARDRATQNGLKNVI